MGNALKLIKYKYIDYKRYRGLIKQGIRPFNEFGLTLFTGRQGSGKTMSMVFEAERLREKHENIFICSNFGYIHADMALKSLADIPEAILIAKGLKKAGVLILWDEIQNDFDSFSKVSRDVLKIVTQQRKQKIKILGTSQVFTRVSKALREQCFEVVECNTLLKRYTKARFYDAEEYSQNIDKPREKRRLHRIRTLKFVQTDELRELFDSYAVIKTLQEQAKEEKNNPRNVVIIQNEV
ncbi:ATPase [Enterococcus sp. BWR-S5]|uniref:ATPase n=1 Tax=Enterococcus sp. BWR-S5 TaxID=2787714 RepID=UPI001920EEB9|nr:ATPase [Enterococcus sp. BWR-S5]MBL1224582.1 ATPase [Enterococcus sp. BWR-S5]MBL1224593.1 ATPase [Enterococcus sp. BWR-S5]